jgi:hypothetical protein
MKGRGMKNLGDVVLTVVVLGGILIVSALFTNWFTRKMYYKCEGCGTLNAKRRTRCRNCDSPLSIAERKE